MSRTSEYIIEWTQPDGYDPSNILRQLPSPIAPGMREIYNYSVRPEGFYLIDRHVDAAISGYAMKLFIDEALAHVDSVVVKKL